MPHQAVVAVLGLQRVPALGVPVGHGVLLRLLEAQRQRHRSTPKADFLLAPALLLALPLGAGWQRKRVLVVALAADGGGRGGTGGAPQAVGALAGHVAPSQCGPGSHFESVGSCAAAHLLDCVAGRLEEDDVDFVEEDAGQKPKAGSQYCNHLHSRHELAVRAGVSRDEGDPHDEEYQHAEGDELGLVKILRQLSRLEGEEETDGCQ